MRHKLTALTMIVALALVAISSPLSTQTMAAPMQTTTIPIEDTPIWRVQLFVKTADVYTSGNGSGASTNFVDARLNADNTTRLYSSFDDAINFERGETYGYDLVLDKVRKLRDITMLELRKPGMDYWCVESVSLLVNGRVVFDMDFAGVGYWVGPNGLIHIPGFQLRTHALWRSYTLPSPPQLISGAELIHRVDSMVGDFMTGPALQISSLPPVHRWRPAGNMMHAVTVTGNGPRTVHVDMNLKYYNYTELNVDLEFDLEFACSSGKLFVMTRNLDMSGYPAIDGMTATTKSLFNMFLQIHLPTKIQTAFQTVTYTNELGQASCPPVRVVGNSIYLF